MNRNPIADPDPRSRRGTSPRARVGEIDLQRSRVGRSDLRHSESAERGARQTAVTRPKPRQVGARERGRIDDG